MSSFAEADHLKAELDALRPLAPEQEARVLQKFRLEWNYNSNAIEGNSLTLGETRSLLLHGLTAAGKPMRDHLDIKGHNEAVLALEEFVRSKYPLTEQFIREMHQVLLGEPYEVAAQTPDGQPTRKRIVPGRYKTSPNNVLTATGEMFYFATVEETPARMHDLVEWYRAEEAAPTLHPIALAAEFHYRFVRIHPFDDGNGRMSRLLMNLILLRHGYPMTVIKNADRNRYLAALSNADAGEFEQFLEFIIENVEASLRLMLRAAQGESVDEPDDLDKKLALLRIQLDTPTNNVTDWDLTTRYKFTSLIIQPWLYNIGSHTQRFDSLFRDKYFKIHGFVSINSELNRQLSSVQSDTNSVIQLINSELSSTIAYKEISIRTIWRTFLKIIQFDLDLAIAFIFHEHFYEIYIKISQEPIDYSISNTKSNLIYKSIYNIDINFSEMEAVNNKVANELFEFISNKILQTQRLKI